MTHKVKLEAGDYNIVPATYTPGYECAFGVAVQGVGCVLRFGNYS